MLPLTSRIMLSCDEPKLSGLMLPYQTIRSSIASALGTVYTEDSVHHIEIHPGNRVLFVFQDGHTEEHFWEDHSRKDSWDTEKRRKAAEKTRIQHQKRKEQEQ